MKRFLRVLMHPLFLCGLALRIGLMAWLEPVAVKVWYAPFLLQTSTALTLDPWGHWLNAGGDIAAFPYGQAMWLMFLPLTWAARGAGLGADVAYGGALLLLDLALFFLLRRLLKGKDGLLTWAYWLSPLVIVPTYVLGLNDLVPVFWLALSLDLLRQAKWSWSGVALAIAISAKLSMVLALPFFLIYLFHNRRLRSMLPLFLRGLVITVAFLAAPFVWSDGGARMLFGNPEVSKVYLFAFELGPHLSVYVVPLVYMISVYAAWRIRRLNFDLFHALLGLQFLLVVLLTPASPGWYVWVVPLLVSYQYASDPTARWFIAGFSSLYVLSVVLGLIPEEALSWTTPDAINHVQSLVHTALVASGLILAIRIARDTIRENDFFRLSRRPFVIGVAGDSGAGKDTFAASIQGLFGGHSVTMLSGDDYHLWDRQKPMWQVMTHLNPMANDLEGFARDLVALTDGRGIQSRHYDHLTGKMGRPFKLASNDIIIASGLHALYLPILRECYNLSIYLDIDESLRRYFKLQRDVHQRGHTVERVMSSFDRREPDSVRFIRPQSEHADLVLALQPIHPRMIAEADGRHPLRFKLVARSLYGLNELLLARVLIGVCGLHVDMQARNDAGEVELVIEGESSAEDVALAAHMICPRIMEFLDLEPQWEAGMLGLMQLLALSHVNQALMKRFIW